MTRRGFVFPMLVLAAGAAGVLALVIVASAAHRAQMAQRHQQRVQGREWCLGGRLLPEGTTVTQGRWTITVGPAHAVSATARELGGGSGTYRIDATGRESWSLAP